MINSCRYSHKKKDYNITVVNDSFSDVINQFVKRSYIYGPKRKDSIKFISVSISLNKDRDTVVGLYSNAKLKEKNFIGKSNKYNLELYFYSKFKKGIRNFYKVDYYYIKNNYKGNLNRHPYTEYYTFSRGNFKENLLKD